MTKYRVILHSDVLLDDMRAIGKRGGDVSKYQRVLHYINKKGGILVPYTISPRELADMFQKGDTVVMTGCYGERGACIDEYTRELIRGGITVVIDNQGIVV
jgi:hypothetical protein